MIYGTTSLVHNFEQALLFPLSYSPAREVIKIVLIDATNLAIGCMSDFRAPVICIAVRQHTGFSSTIPLIVLALLSWSLCL